MVQCKLAGGSLGPAPCPGALGRVGSGNGGGMCQACLSHLLTPPTPLQRCFQTTNGYLSDSRSCSTNYNVAALATSSLVGKQMPTALSCPWRWCCPPWTLAWGRARGARLNCSSGKDCSPEVSHLLCARLPARFYKEQRPGVPAPRSGDWSLRKLWARVFRCLSAVSSPPCSHLHLGPSDLLRDLLQGSLQE